MKEPDEIQYGIQYVRVALKILWAALDELERYIDKTDWREPSPSIETTMQWPSVFGLN